MTSERPSIWRVISDYIRWRFCAHNWEVRDSFPIIRRGDPEDAIPVAFEDVMRCSKCSRLMKFRY